MQGSPYEDGHEGELRARDGEPVAQVRGEYDPHGVVCREPPPRLHSAAQDLGVALRPLVLRGRGLGLGQHQPVQHTHRLETEQKGREDIGSTKSYQMAGF